jgi:hypothetical protein
MSVKLDYRPRSVNRLRARWTIVTVCFGYILGYLSLRASGRIEPFYNQGSFEMDVADGWAVVFLPMIDAEESWHNAFSEPPTGG